MIEFLQQTIDGLAIGMVYAALALALSVVFQGTGMLNFAQGEMAAIAAYLVFTFVLVGVPVWAAILLTVVLSAVGGAVTERVIVRPLEGKSELSLLTLGAALLLGFNALIAIVWGTDPRPFPSPFGMDVLHFGPLRMTFHQIGTVVLIVLVMVLTALLFNKTSVGLRLRAVAQNPESATLLGMSRGLWLMVGWALAGAVGAFAGVVAAPVLALSPSMMLFPLLMALAASTFGGITSRVGAVVGGIIVGIVGSWTGRYVPGLDGGLSIVGPLVLVVIVLIVRPSGIFGRKATVRV